MATCENLHLVLKVFCTVICSRFYTAHQPSTTKANVIASNAVMSYAKRGKKLLKTDIEEDINDCKGAV